MNFVSLAEALALHPPTNTRAESSRWPGIYMIRCGPTGDTYVGRSGNVQKRFAQHAGRLRRGMHPSKKFQSLHDEHGMDAFSFEVLETCIGKSNLGNEERRWIKDLGPTLNPMALNVTTGKFIQSPIRKRKNRKPGYIDHARLAMAGVTYEKIPGVYVITNRINGREYVGQSHDIHARWGAHIGKLSNEKHRVTAWQEDFTAHGLNAFAFQVLIRCEDERQRCLLENNAIRERKAAYNDVENRGSAGWWKRIRASQSEQSQVLQEQGRELARKLLGEFVLFSRGTGERATLKAVENSIEQMLADLIPAAARQKRSA